ncbi:hypothetical protein ACLOAV_009655 [Pseudogymnoascus australis]
MASLDARNAVNDQVLDDRNSSNGKLQTPTTIEEEQDVQQNGHEKSSDEPKSQRYWTRTLVLILVPAITAAWYGVIWIHFVQNVKSDDAVNFRTSSGSLIYYSWFIIGVFGLSWSQYGLAGVEVAMLQSRFWKAPNLVAFLMHSNATWSGMSGWLKAIYHREFHLLWCLLTFASILPFIAFPLSGLVFELGDGYISTSEQPFVVGRNESSFNSRMYPSGNARESWKMGASPTIPGFGVVYTAPDIDRTEHSCLERAPNVLPLAESIPDMFLAPQSDAPLSGEAWGLRIKYECSIVSKASEFTILSQKHESILDEVWPWQNKTLGQVSLKTPSGPTIQIFHTHGGYGDANLWSLSEIAIDSNGFKHYDNRTVNDTQRPVVFEYALWQVHARGYYEDIDNITLPFNSTLGTTIEGMGGPFFMAENKTLAINDTFFKIRGGESYSIPSTSSSPITKNDSVTDLREFLKPEELAAAPPTVLGVGKPIGVRCVLYSDVGMATLDGVTSTFSNFSQQLPRREAESAVRNFGSAAAEIFNGRSFSQMETYPGLKRSGFYDLYSSSHLPQTELSGSIYRYVAYVNSQALLQAFMRALGMDALYLMYDVTSTLDQSWLSTQPKSSRVGKILTVASLIEGRQVGDMVLALFCIWAALSVVLGLVYGFRKRSGDKLDGYAMLKRGAEVGEDARNEYGFLSCSRSFYENEKVKALPGSRL